MHPFWDILAPTTGIIEIQLTTTNKTNQMQVFQGTRENTDMSMKVLKSFPSQFEIKDVYCLESYK